MKTILLGYREVNGRGESITLAGTEVPIAEQIRRITGIKASREYPKGIVRVAFCEVVERNVAVCTKAASKAQAEGRAGEVQRRTEAPKNDPVKQKQTALHAAQKKVSEAAIARNALISEEKGHPTEAGAKKLAKAIADFEAAEADLAKLKSETKK